MRAGRWLCAAAIVAVTAGSSTRAQADDAGLGWLLLGGALLPSDLGADVAFDSHSRTSGLIGWSWQFPLSARYYFPGSSSEKGPLHHRLVGGFDMLPNRSGLWWRGRIGYRYSGHDLFGGVGPALGNGGLTFSPELGAKFLHQGKFPEENPDDPSFHVLVRAGIGAHGFETVSLMLGWSFI